MVTQAMNYRREIDGLRALAVLPVVLCHAGFQAFSGGFIGVDVFFVISGYLITSIVLAELEKGRFSVTSFYERRARRILPALYLVMGASSIFAYAWMMPDELKNFGQSLLATTIFSNNILLAITSGYWDLNSEFKPLLHTWSLAVEEQYYIIFPLLLTLCCKHCRKQLIPIILAVSVMSLLLADWWVASNPKVAFYVLPTRAWEILLGSLTAIFYRRSSEIKDSNNIKNQFLSATGFLLIFSSVILFDNQYPAPGFYTIIPTLGAVLIIFFAKEGTLVNCLLSTRIMVSIGLLSYSLYLWHQPLLAFSRIYAISPPKPGLKLLLISLSFILAYLTWRFVETPFRSKKSISTKTVFYCSAILSISFVTFGYFLNKTYGLSSRIFDPSVKIQDMDKRIYNEKIYSLKKDYFEHPDKTKLLVVGNSFGRDFINATSETFDSTKIEIIYRNDLHDCIFPFKGPVAEKLYGSANAIVFASGFNRACVSEDISFTKSHGKKLFYIGTKHFGYNLNWLIRLDKSSLPNQYNPLLADTLAREREMSSSVPAENFISLLSPTVKDGQIPITDSDGRMLSTDRAHLTKYGARYFGEHVLLKSAYGDFLLNR